MNITLIQPILQEGTHNEKSKNCPSNPSVSYPTLTSFLNQLNLSQYHDLFVDAGVEENNLEQLLELDKDELVEFLFAISMKPFHCVVFKKGIRELKQNFLSNALSSPNNQSKPISFVEPQTSSSPESLNFIPITPLKEKTSDLSPSPQLNNLIHNSINNESPFLYNMAQPIQKDKNQDVQSQDIPSKNTTLTESSISTTVNIYKDIIAQSAIIYGKNSSRILTSYEKAVNNAAIELALQDPALVANKGVLFEQSKAKVLHDGYNYKRGISRSKLLDKNLIITTKERAAKNSEDRNVKIAELERELRVKEEVLSQQVVELNMRIQSTGNNSEFSSTPLKEFEKEIIEINEINKELKNLKRKEHKHQWYEQKKKEKMAQNTGK